MRNPSDDTDAFWKAHGGYYPVCSAGKCDTPPVVMGPPGFQECWCIKHAWLEQPRVRECRWFDMKAKGKR